MPSKKFKVELNGKKIEAIEGETVFELAARSGIAIPALCEHPDFPHKANCRVCVVEILGRRNLATSCSTIVAEGMVINTETERVKMARSLNLEMLYASHVEKCATCVWRLNCKLLQYAGEYKINMNTFAERKRHRKTYKFANAVEIDGTQCIDCNNCIDACSRIQNINYLEMKGKGVSQEICPTSKKGIECILCGQCAVHCPVSAAQEQYDYAEVEKLIKEGKKTVVVQFAPSIRVSIGEEFGLPYGKILTPQLVEALKLLGFKYVFDVNFAADVTTMVEAEELIERITNKGAMPMITSCCPAWVRYVEYYRPDLIPNITTSRSPQMHSGGLIKTFWAEQQKIASSEIVVVSIMPCTAKKFEASRSEMFMNGKRVVDFVLTTRELAFMIKKANIDLAKLKGLESDAPLGVSTGAAALYGGSGGVMESALRTAQAVLCGEDAKLCKERLEFINTRGLDGIKTTVVDFGEKGKVRVGIANGMRHVQELLKRIDEFDYIEMMACPGGCIGGGGEPIPTTNAIRIARAKALLKIDKDKPIREAHKNLEVKDTLAWLKNKGTKIEHQVLHTKYFKRKQ
ncbi:MAG: [FeFe] hydrogenase, group A [bacterium]